MIKYIIRYISFYLQKSICVLNLFDANVEHAIRVSFIWPRTHFQASITAVNKQEIVSLTQLQQNVKSSSINVGPVV